MKRMNCSLMLTESTSAFLCLGSKHGTSGYQLEVRGLASLVNTLRLITPNETARWSQRTDMGCRSNPFPTESLKQHS